MTVVGNQGQICLKEPHGQELEIQGAKPGSHLCGKWRIVFLQIEPVFRGQRDAFISGGKECHDSGKVGEE